MANEVAFRTVCAVAWIHDRLADLVASYASAARIDPTKLSGLVLGGTDPESIERVIEERNATTQGDLENFAAAYAFAAIPARYTLERRRWEWARLRPQAASEASDRTLKDSLSKSNALTETGLSSCRGRVAGERSVRRCWRASGRTRLHRIGSSAKRAFGECLGDKRR